MRLRSFLLGLLVGVALASARDRQVINELRDRLAAAIDRLLRAGLADAHGSGRAEGKGF